jgi:glycerol kinase
MHFATQAGFFTTLVPNSEKPLYALEMKINNTGKRIDQLLQKGVPIYVALEKIAKEVDIIIKKLPMKPKTLIIDGGIIRDNRIVQIQTTVSRLKVKPQGIFDGTAIGVAKLIV